jgi:hypothetical protein
MTQEQKLIKICFDELTKYKAELKKSNHDDAPKWSTKIGHLHDIISTMTYNKIYVETEDSYDELKNLVSGLLKVDLNQAITLIGSKIYALISDIERTHCHKTNA